MYTAGTGLVAAFSVSADGATLTQTSTLPSSSSFDGFLPIDLEVVDGGLLVSAMKQLPEGGSFAPPAVSRIYKVDLPSPYTTPGAVTMLVEQTGTPPSTSFQFLYTLSLGRSGTVFVSDGQHSSSPSLSVYSFGAQDVVCAGGYVASSTVPGVCQVCLWSKSGACST